MKKLEKFQDDKIKNLHMCVGGIVYTTCGAQNCADEAGSRETLANGNYQYDDVNTSDHLFYALFKNALCVPLFY